MLNVTLKTKEKSAFPCLGGRSLRISQSHFQSLPQTVHVDSSGSLAIFIFVSVASFIATDHRGSKSQPSER